MCPAWWACNIRLSSPASSTRTCRTVSAGVRIFSPPGFLRQESGCQQRQGLMVMPPLPCPDLVVGQPRLPLGTLEALLDPAPRLEDPGELRQGAPQHRVGQQVVMLERPVPLLLPEDHQRL